MYSLPLPSLTSVEAYTNSIDTIRDKARQAPYENAKQAVLLKCEYFDTLATQGLLGSATEQCFAIDGLSIQDMVELYDKQFNARKRTKSMPNSIKNAAPNSRCPYCGRGTVTQLDHYLPKSAFAGPAVHPANLIPACGDCNLAKRDYSPGCNNPAVLHPYFDAAFDFEWLVAALRPDAQGAPVISFGVTSENIDATLKERLEQHLKVFQLKQRYTIWAAQALDELNLYVQSKPGQSMTLDQARQHLKTNATISSGDRKNAWDKAAFTAMANSEWYLCTYLGLLDADATVAGA